MGSTLIEKIIEKNTGLSKVTPGQIVTVNVDRVMIHDIFIPFVADKFEEMGFTKLWDPDKVVLIYDHLVPTSAVEDVRHFKIGDAFADKYGLTHVHRRDGICHQLMTEAGFFSFKYWPVPVKVPPVPTPAIKISTSPSVSFQISGPVVALWIAGFAGFTNCPGMKLPSISSESSFAFAIAPFIPLAPLVRTISAP